MGRFLLLIFYIVAVIFSFYVESLTGSDWLFYTLLLWALILGFAFIRITFFNDDGSKF